MNKRILSGLFLLLLLGLPPALYAQNHKEILMAAGEGISGYLEKIPEGQEGLYGFSSRSEFARAGLGRPYQVLALDPQFFEKDADPGKESLRAAGEWMVPVAVDGHYRSLLTLARMEGEWRVVGLGAAGLARELQDLERRLGNPDMPGRLLMVHALTADFVLEQAPLPDESPRAYLLASARMGLEKTMKPGDYYPMPVLLETIREITRDITPSF